MHVFIWPSKTRNGVHLWEWSQHRRTCAVTAWCAHSATIEGLFTLQGTLWLSDGTVMFVEQKVIEACEERSGGCTLALFQNKHFQSFWSIWCWFYTVKNVLWCTVFQVVCLELLCSTTRELQSAVHARRDFQYSDSKWRKRSTKEPGRGQITWRSGSRKRQVSSAASSQLIDTKKSLSKLLCKWRVWMTHFWDCATNGKGKRLVQRRRSFWRSCANISILEWAHLSQCPTDVSSRQDAADEVTLLNKSQLHNDKAALAVRTCFCPSDSLFYETEAGLVPVDSDATVYRTCPDRTVLLNEVGSPLSDFCLVRRKLLLSQLVFIFQRNKERKIVDTQIWSAGIAWSRSAQKRYWLHCPRQGMPGTCRSMSCDIRQTILVPVWGTCPIAFLTVIKEQELVKEVLRKWAAVVADRRGVMGGGEGVWNSGAFLPNLPSFLPSFLPSSLPSSFPLFLPSFLPSVHHSYCLSSWTFLYCGKQLAMRIFLAVVSQFLPV